MRIREGWFSTAITGRAERIRMGNKWERARVTRDAVNTFQIKQTHKKKNLDNPTKMHQIRNTIK